MSTGGLELPAVSPWPCIVYREDIKGFTPLLLAIKRKSLKVVELLLSEGVVSNGASHHNSAHLSALSLACSVGSYDIVKLLMDEKAEIKVKDGMKKTPLMEAAEHNRPKGPFFYGIRKIFN